MSICYWTTTQKYKVKLAKQNPQGTRKKYKRNTGEKTSKPCKTHGWIKNVATQNVFKRNKWFPRDIDVFSHMVRCRIISSRLRDFTNGSEQRGLSEITTNSNAKNIKRDGLHYEPA
jgi:hypothetical protein